MDAYGREYCIPDAKGSRTIAVSTSKQKYPFNLNQEKSCQTQKRVMHTSKLPAIIRNVQSTTPWQQKVTTRTIWMKPSHHPVKPWVVARLPANSPPPPAVVPVSNPTEALIQGFAISASCACRVTQTLTVRSPEMTLPWVGLLLFAY
jgi:hypothetical protein